MKSLLTNPCNPATRMEQARKVAGKQYGRHRVTPIGLIGANARAPETHIPPKPVTPATLQPIKRPTFVVSITSTPGHSTPFEIRMRQWLKIGLRAFGLKAEWKAAETAIQTPAAAPEGMNAQ